MNPSFISLDWGTSSLRAALVSADGEIMESRSAPGGVMTVKDRDFHTPLNAICKAWIDTHGCPIVASGMIGSRQGWVEAPYLACPATPAAAAVAFTTLSVADKVDMHIIPGVRCGGIDSIHDVMRGEETQIWGAGVDSECLCVLPGTHSKWVFVGAGAMITHFATYITGELYGLLTRHGILGRLMEFGSRDDDAFQAGVSLGLRHPNQATHVVFAARTTRLMNELPSTALPDYLSGILIGVEVASAMASYTLNETRLVVLIGDSDLCRRYQFALEAAGLRVERTIEEATVQGHVRIAREAGIVGPRSLSGYTPVLSHAAQLAGF
ncbi:2-dehydro-3-deoxygalactonokinase [Paraburkholderia agricolaris]|uniref:2-dehydro-3-deoxygalactonokinase n=1 Tax=Paraburkholderia agricolaris TaxID=2152888 RepID=UPI00129296A4|nr:2-dehydro-3-deoxygalactonokinase [Paraburkholderia agricolaris]